MGDEDLMSPEKKIQNVKGQATRQGRDARNLATDTADAFFSSSSSSSSSFCR